MPNPEPIVLNEKLGSILVRLYDTLYAWRGPSGWWPAETPFEVCVGAILTQNAPWSGVRRSIQTLSVEGLLNPEDIAEAPAETIARAIRPSIYYNQKAKRLKTFCRFLNDRFGGEVEAMGSIAMDEARGMLLSLPGIGRETADSILCYALKKPVFVIDAYTRRILGRHRLVPDLSMDYDDLRGLFENAFPPDADFYGEYHALLCLLGAEFCRRKPLCDMCPARSALGNPHL